MPTFLRLEVAGMKCLLGKCFECAVINLILNIKNQADLRGGAGRKTVLLIFQPTHFIVHLL